MAKFCVFCGNAPTDKNKEHIIPRWLIKMTDHPGRVTKFGFPKLPNGSAEQREFPFDRFTFPACESCNTRHSALESEAMSVMSSILDRKAISAVSASVLLDWFDKVRVGLWLGFQMLEKNVLDIEPNFHIERRIGQYDRMLIIQRASEHKTRLNFTGADSVSFAYSPSAFSLVVNDTYFTNISASFLISRRVGFPYPASMYLVPDRADILCDIQPGRERITLPLLQRPIAEGGVRLYQPMFRLTLASERPSEYDCDYVRRHSMDFDRGIGSIFVQHEGKADVSEMRRADSISINPTAAMGDEELMLRTAINVYEWQDWLSTGQVSLEKLRLDQRKYVRGRQSLARRMNAVLVNHHQRLLKKWGYAR
jgi:hypothetical protein